MSCLVEGTQKQLDRCYLNTLWVRRGLMSLPHSTLFEHFVLHLFLGPCLVFAPWLTEFPSNRYDAVAAGTLTLPYFLYMGPTAGFIHPILAHMHVFCR